MKDKHGIRIYPGAARLNQFDEITVSRFTPSKHKPEELQKLYTQYVKQADELLKAFRRVRKTGDASWTYNGVTLLYQTANAIKQAGEIKSWVKICRKDRGEE